MLRIVPSTEAGRLLKRRAARLAEAEQTVRPILDDVRKRGDKALLEYARKFDGLTARSVRVPERELEAAAAALAWRNSRCRESTRRRSRRGCAWVR